jgi:hypothetical protein
MECNRWWSATVLSAAVGIAGCGGPISSIERGRANTLVERAVTQLEPYKIAPHDTDREIRDPRWLSEHYVWLDRTVEHRDKLFVHLTGQNNPGQNTVPSQSSYLAREAAQLGYHVIVLMYPNTVGVGGGAASICKANKEGKVDEVCQENVRLQVLDGQERSPPIPGLTEAEGVYNRLTKLLVHLKDTRPEEEKWSKYLDGGTPDWKVNWKKIVISGFSYGGSEAALIAQFHRVHRVTLFAAPRDGFGVVPSAWVAPGQTRANRYYGLVHDQDPLAKVTLASWDKLGMSRFGDAISEEGGVATFEGTHMLRTNRLPSTGNVANAHGSVATDQLTPLEPDGTTPQLRAAWRYMLGADTEEDD